MRSIMKKNVIIICLLKDITGFRGSKEELSHFNEAGRAKIALLRKSVERLDDYVSDLNNPTLTAEVDSHRQQFTRFNFTKQFSN